jgi:hypothetical protein
LGRFNAIAAASGVIQNIALQRDGSVVVWQKNGGYEIPGTLVFHRFHTIIAVAAVRSGGFMALKEDGSVVAWEEPWTEYGITETPVPSVLK